MDFRTLYTKRVRVSQESGGATMTKQSEAAACDINNILKRYQKTGILPSMGQGQFIDVSGVEDLHQAMMLVDRAQASFDALGAKVREHFKNDPMELVKAAFDPARREEFEKLGLVEKGELPTLTGVPGGDTGATEQPKA